MIPIGHSVRLAVVKKVGRTFIDFEFLDRIDAQTFRAPIPHPYAGRGGGVLVGIEKDTIIMVASGPSEKWYCIGIVPDHNFYFDLDGASDVRGDETSYPNMSEGEVCIKSNQGSQIDLLKSGNIRIDSGAGLSSGDLELSRQTKTLFSRIENNYNFGEYGRLIQGVIKRDLNVEESTEDAISTNFLDSEIYDRFLSTVGRFAKNEIQPRTSRLTKQLIRNPSLVEKREILYEYADSFNVKDFEQELSATGISDTPQRDSSLREHRRTDVLNLNLKNFNHLIEKVEGTLVDIYGNVLDINRNVIDIPDAKDIKTDGSDSAGLKRVYDHHRRSVKFHYEINSRKDISTSEPPESDKTSDNGRNFSRWSVDVDGEGLTKINIPASSETGNIPVLNRYFTERDQISERKRGKGRRDIKPEQFGAPGVKIENSKYKPSSSVTAGTAYHDISKVAESIFAQGSLKGKAKILESSTENKDGKINNKIGSTSPNAGGRSMHANLDGSMELSVGADTINKKSIVLDTQGAVISSIGKDKNGRSIIQQTDGDVILQIGGSTPASGGALNLAQAGKLEIHVSRGAGGTPQKILIDQNGMTLDVQGNLMLKSSGDMALDAAGRLLLNGSLIFMYGSTEVEQRQIGGSETLIVRAGSPQFT
jgi:hypothetical protein